MDRAFAELMTKFLTDEQRKSIQVAMDKCAAQFTLDDFIELNALHRHWVAADTIKQYTKKLPPSPSDKSSHQPLYAVIAMSTSFKAIEVWYGLLYVVVEGYQSISLKDKDIDSVLADERKVSLLRRFRNSVFHYQKNPEPDKYMEFLLEGETEVWAHKLHKAFKNFFETNIPVQALMEIIGAE